VPSRSSSNKIAHQDSTPFTIFILPHQDSSALRLHKPIKGSTHHSLEATFLAQRNQSPVIRLHNLVECCTMIFDKKKEEQVKITYSKKRLAKSPYIFHSNFNLPFQLTNHRLFQRIELALSGIIQLTD